MASGSWKKLLRTYGGSPPNPSKGLWQDPILGYFETHGTMEFKPGAQYDLTPSEKQAVWERNKMKELMKLEFMRREYDPIRRRYQPGFTMDPGIFRWYAADMSDFETFRLTPKTMLVTFFLITMPILGFMAGIIRDRADQDRMCRKGQLLWWDRQDGRMQSAAGMAVSGAAFGHRGMDYYVDSVYS